MLQHSAAHLELEEADLLVGARRCDQGQLLGESHVRDGVGVGIRNAAQDWKRREDGLMEASIDRWGKGGTVSLAALAAEVGARRYLVCHSDALVPPSREQQPVASYVAQTGDFRGVHARFFEHGAVQKVEDADDAVLIAHDQLAEAGIEGGHGNVDGAGCETSRWGAVIAAERLHRTTGQGGQAVRECDSSTGDLDTHAEYVCDGEEELIGLHVAEE